MKFTQSQVLEMRKAADDYADVQSSDMQAIGKISDERFASLAADRALEAAASMADRYGHRWVGGSFFELAHTIRAMKEHQ